MPSPVGHALAGVAAAWLSGGRLPQGWHSPLVLPCPGRSLASFDVTARSAEIVLFSVAAIAPDLDLLFGTHSTYTHSIGAVVIVFALAMAAGGVRLWRVALGIAAAWGSHILLDWLGNDTSPPIGVMALWPFSSDHYQSSLFVFDAISRRYWLPEQFVVGNLRAVAKEMAILIPAAWLASRWRGRAGTRLTPRATPTAD
jgi:membrane-bound metal-dependent hydrolase YbcI (DUF457 family)